MRKRAVIDSGPLVAYFDQDDASHEKSFKFMTEYEGELFATLAVLTEVTHFLKFNIQKQIDFLYWVKKGAVNLVDIENRDLERACYLTRKYSDLPMDFADCTLVIVAEKFNIKSVITLDSDFYVYRTLSSNYLESLMDAE